MTILDRVNMALESHDMEVDSIDKLLTMAYYIGRERGVRDFSERVNAHLDGQRKRAESCRYYNMASAVIGSARYIYSPDYAGDMTATFGSDDTNL